MIARGRPRRLGRRRRLTLAACLIVLLGGGWLWFRDSSLVAVRKVDVTGLTGPGVTQIRRQLVNQALRMTTLDYDVAKLRGAVARHPFIVGLTVSAGFPHELTIAVREQVPIAKVSVGGRFVAVDSSGALLSPGIATRTLPLVPLRDRSGGERITAPGALDAIRALTSAPYDLLPRIASATWSPARGVIVQLRRGPQLFFGAMDSLASKWQAALAVLASPSSVGAQYIDLSDPSHPAAGVDGRKGGTVTVPAAGQTGSTGQLAASTGASGAAGGGTGALAGSTGAAAGSTGATGASASNTGTGG